MHTYGWESIGSTSHPRHRMSIAAQEVWAERDRLIDERELTSDLWSAEWDEMSDWIDYLADTARILEKLASGEMVIVFSEGAD